MCACVNWQMAFFSHTFLLGPLKVVVDGGLSVCVCVYVCVGGVLGAGEVLGYSGIVSVPQM